MALLAVMEDEACALKLKENLQEELKAMEEASKANVNERGSSHRRGQASGGTGKC